MATAESLLTAMERNGIGASVVCGFGWKDPGLRKMTNEYLLEAASSHPGKLYPFAVTPIGGEGGMVDEAHSWLERGMRGIGEVAFYVKGMTRNSYTMMDGLAELAGQYGVPLLIHVNEPVGHSYPGKIVIRFEALYQFLRRHQGVTVVLAHWGGGLLFYELMPSVAACTNNVYYDTAASPYLYRPMIYRIAVDIVSPDRILFGSDYPLISPSRYIKEMHAERLPELVLQRILGDNALRLLSEGSTPGTRNVQADS